MALYGITYRCGHTGQVQIYGTNVHGERGRKAAWYESQDCPACKAKQARSSSDDGMAVLEGSDKQVAWAGDIRSRVMEEMRDARQTMAGQGAGREDLERADAIIAWMAAQPSAAWWIDHKTTAMASLACRQAMAGKEA